MRGVWERLSKLDKANGERNGRRSGDGHGFWMSAAVVAALLVGVALTPTARADDGPATPGRGVRLSSVTGQVQASLGGQVIADQALENMTLFEGTRLVTGEDGRAEVQFEDGSVARLSPNSSFTITKLKGTGTSGEAEVALEMGLGYFELQGNGQAGSIDVKFGDSTVTSTGFAVMRISMDEAPGQMAVFSGNVHLSNGALGSEDVHGGQSLKLRGKDGSFTVADTIEPDSWDSWNADRDQALNALAATDTGAANGQPDSSNPAWSDLNANGNWYNVQGQGQVWSPYDASSPDWEPYGNGNWVWSPRFGYSWVSDDSWGYMPFSCGMWNWYSGFGWGWAPGVGGCSPWWNSGGYVLNVAGGPGWWHAPIVPHEPPHRYPGPIHGRPAPVVAVNRHITAPANTVLPARDLGVPVVLAGQTVMPLRPLSARPEYTRGGMGGSGSTGGGANGARTAAVFGVPGSAARTVPYSNAYTRMGSTGAGSTGRTLGNSSGSHPASSGSPGGHAAPAASHSSSGGGGGGHASSGGGGGGGGGGGHASSGGGGGGGGATSHK